MQKTRIEWADYTWNPVTGCWGPEGSPSSPRRCSYCYAHAMVRRFGKDWGYDFSPTFHKDRLQEPFNLKKPSRIFVSSMGDLFRDFVPKEWIEKVINQARYNGRHTFIFLTQNPKRYEEFEFAGNCWLGTTITGGDFKSKDKLNYLVQLKLDLSWRKFTYRNNIFISWEPIISEMPTNLARGAHNHFKYVDWLIMGAMTGPMAKQYRPDPEWIKKAVDACRKNDVKIFMKDSIAPYWDGELIREWPKG